MNNKKDIEEDIKILEDIEILEFTASKIYMNPEKINIALKNLIKAYKDREKLEVKANAYDSLVKKIKKDIEEYPEATYTKYYLLDCLELLDTEK